MTPKQLLLLALVAGLAWPVAGWADDDTAASDTEAPAPKPRRSHIPVTEEDAPADAPAGDPPAAEPAPERPAKVKPAAEEPEPEQPPAPPPAPAPAPEQPAPEAAAPAPSSPPPPADGAQQTTLKLVFFGIYDKETDSNDSDQSHQLESDVRRTLQLWKGFELMQDADLEKMIPRVARGDIAQAAKPGEKLAALDKATVNVSGDYGIVGKFRKAGGKELVRLRVITMPDRESTPPGGFIDSWTEELPVESLPTLIDHARNTIYASASDRVQQKSWPYAVIMHVPPTAAISGKAFRLAANMLCRGDCHLVLHYIPMGLDSVEGPEHTKTMVRDDETAAYHAEMKNLVPGKIRYYFAVMASDKKPLDADISAGTKDEPYEFKVLGPSDTIPGGENQTSEATKANEGDGTDTRPDFLRNPVGGTVILGVAGAALVAAFITAPTTGAWKPGATEKQGYEAQKDEVGVILPFALAGALAIAGGVILGLELSPPPGSKPEQPNPSGAGGE